MTSAAGYEERYCLFLDILGFQSHIDETVNPKADSKHPMTFSRLKSALDKISNGVNYRQAVVVAGQMHPSSRQVTQFSDSIVVSYLKNEQNGSGVSSILWDVHRLQLELVPYGILLRGAITSGLLYHDQSLVFGPALNEAVALEKLASYPRVILDGQIFDEASLPRPYRQKRKLELTRSISSMVEMDLDGLYYIDYFNVQSDDFNEDWYDLWEYLDALRKLIKGLANKKSPSIKVKHSWLRIKFNEMAGQFKRNNFRKFGAHRIPDEDVSLFSEIKPF